MSFSDESPRPAIEPIDSPTSSEERLWAMLAHLFAVLGNTAGVLQWVGPLVVYLVFKDTSRFVAFHALQALYFHLGVLVATAFAFVLAIVTCGILVPLVFALPIAALVYSIVAALKAYDGQLFEYWVVGRWARSQVGI